MQSGRARRFRWRGWLFGLCLTLGGCATSQAQLERALRSDRNPAAHTHDLEAQYHVHCPDLIEIHVDGHPRRSGSRAVGPDGQVFLDPSTAVRVAGAPLPAVRAGIAHRLGVPDQAVHVRVAEHRSQSLYLFSDTHGGQKVVSYLGPETILDLLQRLGHPSPGAALRDVQVVRAHVADGKPPEVFHIDLPAVLLAHDLQTNIRLEPNDRIYIAETRGSRLACCVPPLLLPVYRQLCGLGE
jgi:protein involved in polysaccharide export with SLBB domain